MGSRYVILILLGDPAQLAAVSSKDIFGSDLWMTFNMLLLREVVRTKDPDKQCLFDEVTLGIYDAEVYKILHSKWEQEDLGKVDLKATIIICSKTRM